MDWLYCLQFYSTSPWLGMISSLVYIHDELGVRALQLSSVAQLVRALHQNHRFNSCQGPKVSFFAVIPG